MNHKNIIIKYETCFNAVIFIQIQWVRYFHKTIKQIVNDNNCVSIPNMGYIYYLNIIFEKKIYCVLFFQRQRSYWRSCCNLISFRRFLRKRIPLGHRDYLLRKYNYSGSGQLLQDRHDTLRDNFPRLFTSATATII